MNIQRRPPELRARRPLPEEDTPREKQARIDRLNGKLSLSDIFWNLFLGFLICGGILAMFHYMLAVDAAAASYAGGF